MTRRTRRARNWSSTAVSRSSKPYRHEPMRGSTQPAVLASRTDGGRFQFKELSMESRAASSTEHVRTHPAFHEVWVPRNR
ncbi:hypothetical protein D0B32_08385 [Paraburkholderia sp. DHOC27]|nr:hypothetical protein D0B32_08385 [Paraburkholderia sp. DHOC27]